MYKLEQNMHDFVKLKNIHYQHFKTHYQNLNGNNTLILNILLMTFWSLFNKIVCLKKFMWTSFEW